MNDLFENLSVIKRNGKKVEFDGSKIALAVKKGFDNITVLEDDDDKKDSIYGAGTGCFDIRSCC